MTISIARPNSTNTNEFLSATKVEPADVWDLDRVPAARVAHRHVRTLDGNNRMNESPLRTPPERAYTVNTALETRREKRAATLMGALLGLGLVAGSIFGGAFSVEEDGYAPAETNEPANLQNAVASVNYR
nr:Uncharacterised protein [Streptococcus thermophilus]